MGAWDWAWYLVKLDNGDVAKHSSGGLCVKSINEGLVEAGPSEVHSALCAFCVFSQLTPTREHHGTKDGSA